MTLNLTEAKRIAERAMEEARELDIRICVAVCDVGGQIILLNRMDGAIWAANWGCQAKARGASAFGANTTELEAADQALLLDGIESAGGGHMVLSGGGVPIYRDNVLVGACGVGGGTGDEDGACSRAGVAAL